jgi:hypothetical protein
MRDLLAAPDDDAVPWLHPIAVDDDGSDTAPLPPEYCSGPISHLLLPSGDGPIRDHLGCLRRLHPLASCRRPPRLRVEREKTRPWLREREESRRLIYF